MNLYREFYREHKHKLFNYLMRMTGDCDLATELMQESFTRYLEHYKESPYRVSLLYAIARNALFDVLRRRDRTTPLNDEEESLTDDDQEQTLLVRDEYRRVLSAMSQLEQTERDILALIVSTGLSYKEVAAIAGISEANVKVKVHRARLTLRQILSEGGNYE
ncbi:RNA polymerase sigma factor, sigma-70 family [uncultured Desulfobacterium sp.]|uniref:RNA polymerase sigma factor, sigma-70 family n=1 Tax=uncultured Desulfobacterium sp. TaxID=201089 RepID=A0A445N0B8_9BACT|nr:RNA polymerase sigma factor, sigma-70 family [uncultured Desulfobacterium sp.]